MKQILITKEMVVQKGLIAWRKLRLIFICCGGSYDSKREDVVENKGGTMTWVGILKSKSMDQKCNVRVLKLVNKDDFIMEEACGLKKGDVTNSSHDGQNINDIRSGGMMGVNDRLRRGDVSKSSYDGKIFMK
jgi:hypothetical protein